MPDRSAFFCEPRDGFAHRLGSQRGGTSVIGQQPPLWFPLKEDALLGPVTIQEVKHLAVQEDRSGAPLGLGWASCCPPLAVTAFGAAASMMSLRTSAGVAVLFSGLSSLSRKIPG